MGNITLNIVEPGTAPSSASVDPAVSNTGLFTHGIGGPEAAIIGVGTIILISAIALIIFLLSRHNNKRTIHMHMTQFVFLEP